MKRFEIPEMKDERYADIKYYNNPEDSEAFIPIRFYLTNSTDNALFTLTRASQTLFDHAREFGQTKNFTEDQLKNGFTNAELKKLQKKSADDAVNKVIFSLALTIQEVTTGIFDATSTPETPITTLISEILSSLNKAFSLKNTLKVLDKDKLAPENINKNTIEMSRHLRDALGEITSVVSVIFDEFTNVKFLEEQDFATRTAIRVAAGIVRKIYDFAKTSHDNLDIAIKNYEKKQLEAPKVGAATDSSKAQAQPQRNLAELAKSMTYPEIKDRIVELKDQIHKNREEVKKAQQIIDDFEPLSEQLQQKLNVNNKKNAEELMRLLNKTNPSPVLRKTFEKLKSDYDKINPKKVYRTEIGEKLAEKTKPFRKKSSAILNPQKLEESTAVYKHLWTAVTHHVNSTIKQNTDKIVGLHKTMKDDQEELMFLESIKAPHIFTKAFWVNLWNTIWNKISGQPPKVKQPKKEVIEAPSAVNKDEAEDDSLEGASFQPNAYSKPVEGSSKAPEATKTAKSATTKVEDEISEESDEKSIKKQ